MPRRLTRRAVLAAATAAGLQLARPRGAAARHKPVIMTVSGPIAPEKLGVCLPHEHVLVDFIGADRVSRNRYDAQEAFEVVLPHLRQLRALGCQSLAECTPALIGRDPALLLRLAEASGVQLVTNTGYYAAAGGKFLPKSFAQATARELANLWIAEFRQGIEGTGVRPGFIKIGVDAGALNEQAKKLLEAAALAQRETGLTIAAHTGDGTAALEQLALLGGMKAPLDQFIWVHAQNEADTARHAAAAERGAWVEFDGVGPETLERHVAMVRGMKEKGLLSRVLISHDAGWYNVGEPRGGTFRPYNVLFENFLPALRKAGLTDAELRQLTVDHPREALTIRAAGQGQKSCQDRSELPSHGRLA